MTRTNWSGKQKSLGLDLGQTKQRRKRSERSDTESGKRSRKSRKQVLSLDKNEDPLKKKYDLWYGDNTLAYVLFDENQNLDLESSPTWL
jgi:hypothetical protein